MFHRLNNEMSCYEEGSALLVPQDGVAGCRGRSSLRQVLIGLEHERENCAIRQVEEFRASCKEGAVAKYLREGQTKKADRLNHWRCAISVLVALWGNVPAFAVLICNETD
jgi:hypothetical protein